MKRLHVHVSVGDLADSVRFYSAMFGEEPTVLKDDYAKWMLEDPRVNFAVSRRGRAGGLDHLGIQVDSGEELAEVSRRLASAERPLVEQTDAACCYARSDKSWVSDPQGIAWETFHTHGDHTVYGEDRIDRADLEVVEPKSCCAPACCAEPAAS